MKFTQMSDTELITARMLANESDLKLIDRELNVREEIKALAKSGVNKTEANSVLFENEELPNNEELMKIVAECTKNVNHRCEVVPYMSVDWTGGTITGVVCDKKRGRVMYCILTDTGAHISKVYNHLLLKITDEVVTPVKLRKHLPKLTPEECQQLFDSLIPLIGLPVRNKKDGTVGRATSITIDKKSRCGMIRIVFATKVISRVKNADDIEFLPADDETADANARCVKTRPQRFKKFTQAPADKITMLQNEIAECERKEALIHERIEARKKLLEETKSGLNDALTK